MDTLPLWFWLPPAVVGWAVILFRVSLWLFGADDPNPSERTPLDELEQSGTYRR